MKKRITALFCVLIVISMLSANTVFAQEAPAVQVIDVDSADAGTAPAAGSYTITEDGEPVLEVVHVKAPGLTAALDDTAANGYYTADFMLPDTNYRVFLTGLTRNNADEIRRAIIESYTEGEDLSLENLGFIDTEKTKIDDGDENLCWAASTSNLLTYTGWAAQAGFTSADDVFEAFISAFDDASGNIHYATGWFINGVSAPEGAQPAAGTGRYLPQYHYADMVENYERLYEDCAAKLGTVYDRLRSGYGVSLSVDIYGAQGYEGGHAITCWGFVTDIRYPDTHKLHYKSIFITDSDSDKFLVEEGMDRRDATDVMSLFALDPVEQEGIDTYQFRITDQQIALITEAYTMVRYSDDFPHETAADATLDPQTAPDIVIEPFVLTDDEFNDDETKTAFSPDAPIYYHPYMMNVANARYTGPLYLTVTMTNAQGDTIYSRNFSYSQTVNINLSSGMAFVRQSIPNPGVGDYTITASFNPEHNVTEAYYFNNIKSVSFKVRERYLVGDADNDGAVTSIDATVIQRVLARLNIGIDENIDQRGDVNMSGDLDLTDVTFLQRYLAEMPIIYSVDVLRFYD